MSNKSFFNNRFYSKPNLDSNIVNQDGFSGIVAGDDQPETCDKVWQASLGDMLDDIALVCAMNTLPVVAEKAAVKVVGPDLPNAESEAHTFVPKIVLQSPYRFVGERLKNLGRPVLRRSRSPFQFLGAFGGGAANQ